MMNLSSISVKWRTLLFSLCAYIICALCPALQRVALASDIFHPVYLIDDVNLCEAQHIAKDRDGFMWVVYADGIARYDGSHIYQYRFDYNYFRQIFITSKDEIFTFKIHSKLQVAKYDALYDKFESEKIELEGFSSNTVVLSSVVDDRGNLFVGTSNGVVLYDGASKEWRYLEGLREKRVVSLTVADDELVVSDGSKFYSMSLAAGGGFAVSERCCEIGSTLDITATLYDKERNRIFVGTSSSGLYLYDMASGEVAECSKLGLRNVTVRDLESYEDDKLLIGVDGMGIIMVDRKSLEVLKHYYYKDQYFYTIESNAIYDLYVDNERRIYAATYAHGLQVLDNNNLNYRVITTRNKFGVPQRNAINSIYEDRRGEFWFGTNNGVYLRRLEAGNAIWEHFRFDAQAKVNNPVVLSIEGVGDDIFAGGFGSGLLRVDREKHLLRTLESGARSRKNYIFTLFSDSDDGLWVGGKFPLTWCDAQGRGQGEYGERDGVSSIVDLNERNLIYCASSHLFTLDKVSREVAPFLFPESLVQELGRTPMVQSVRKSGNALYFATTNCGLISFNLITSQFKSYTAVLGESHRNILAFEIDYQGNAWLATMSGVAYVDLDFSFVRSYKLSSLNGVEPFIRGASLLCRDGRILFGTLDGAMLIDPNKMEHTASSSQPPRFTDLKISYNSVLRHPELLDMHKPLNELETIKLRYSQNTFSFSFTQLDFSRYDSPAYSYKLHGADDEWSPMSRRGVAEYRNVSAGSYRFEVRVYPTLDSKEYVSRSVDIKIFEPWYLSAWMILLYMVLVVASASGALYLYLKRRERMQQQEKIDYYMNILHSIEIPLRVIKVPLSYVARDRGLSMTARQMLERVLRSVDRMSSQLDRLVSMTGMIQSREMEVGELSLHDYMREVVDNFWEYALMNNVTLKLNLKHPNQIVQVSREALDKVMDNLLSNAIKYSDKSGSEVVINLYYEDRWWRVEVINRGCTIPSGEQRNIFRRIYRADNQVNRDTASSGLGLLLTGRIVRDMKGRIRFESSESRGTIFSVRLPMKFQDGVVVPQEEGDAEELDNKYSEEMSDSAVVDSTIAEIEGRMRDVATSGLMVEGELCAVPLNDGDRVLLDSVQRIIGENLSDCNFTVDTICAELCMSRSVFYNKMKGLTAQTPNEMLRSARMEHAVELLRTSDFTIQMVADKVGFADAKYFSRVFYKHHGCYPSKFRN